MKSLSGKQIVILIAVVAVIAAAVCVVYFMPGFPGSEMKFDDSSLVPMRGGNVEITLSEIPKVTAPVSSQAQTTAAENLKTKPTPYKNNGVSGKSEMIVVNKPSAETRPLKGEFYNPDYVSLTAGTIDYVTGESKYTNRDGKSFEMYNLASGRRISKTDADFIKKGHNLPLNSLNVVSASPTDKGGYDIVLSTDWCVPYAVNAYPQNYTSGYEGKVFNVRNYTVNSLDFVFYHTKSGSGTINAGSGSVVSKGEWIKSGDDTVTLRFTLSKPGGLYGYTVRYDSAGNMVISFRPKLKSLPGAVIVIDPGHGGKDPGAPGADGKSYEADQTLKIATYLASYLAQSGCSVYMTRTQDKTVSLEERRSMAEQLSPDLYVSVHLNSSENKSQNGTSTYYYNGFSKNLAEKINRRLVNAFQTFCYKNNPKMLSGLDDGDNYYPFYVLRSDGYPSVLVETGYISHDYESAFLIDDAYQQVFAYAIYGGIADYISG